MPTTDADMEEALRAAKAKKVMIDHHQQPELARFYLQRYGHELHLSDGL